MSCILFKHAGLTGSSIICFWEGALQPTLVNMNKKTMMMMKFDYYDIT